MTCSAAAPAGRISILGQISAPAVMDYFLASTRFNQVACSSLNRSENQLSDTWRGFRRYTHSYIWGLQMGIGYKTKSYSILKHIFTLSPQCKRHYENIWALFFFICVKEWSVLGYEVMQSAFETSYLYMRFQTIQHSMYSVSHTTIWNENVKNFNFL